MRDSIHIYVNGTKYDVRGQQGFSSLSNFLRYDLGLTGTKTSCFEGGCGSCSVLVGRPRAGRIEYRPINSCIHFLFQLDCTHVVTIEGLTSLRQLDVVQEAMVGCHGSQCGYCTPGFVVTLTGLFDTASRLDSPALDPAALRRGLVGNLCRCTGYMQILEAASSIAPHSFKPLSRRFDEKEILADLTTQLATDVRVEVAENGRRLLYIPGGIESALTFLEENPTARVVGGATNLGVEWSVGHGPEILLSLSRVSGLQEVNVDDEVLVLGGTATWTDVENRVRDLIPEFHRLLERFGSPQIRNVGTVAGSLVNASPTADSLPFLYVSRAEVVLMSARCHRRVAIEDFHGREGTAAMMSSTEVIHSVRVPVPRKDDWLRLYKISTRRHMDVATVCAAILVRRSGDSIVEAKLAYGGVGSRVFRLPKTEAFLAGRLFDEESFSEAGRIAAGEITPISDVFGSAEFRRELAGALPLKFFDECSSGRIEPGRAGQKMGTSG